MRISPDNAVENGWIDTTRKKRDTAQATGLFADGPLPSGGNVFVEIIVFLPRAPTAREHHARIMVSRSWREGNTHHGLGGIISFGGLRAACEEPGSLSGVPRLEGGV